MEWYFIVLIIIGGILVLYCLLDFVVAYFIMNIMLMVPVVTYEDVIKSESEWEKTTEEEIKSLNMEDFRIKSKMGYELQASYIAKKKDIKFKDGKERVVVMVHGWTSNRYGMIPYAKIYLDLGFHVFLYDHRNHFQSDRVITTMGDKEADDLQTVIEYIRNRMGDNIIIGTQGESMGSATAMIHAGRYKSVDFMSEDCGYNSLKELLHFQCFDLKHLPTFPTLLFGDLIFRIRAKSKFSIVEPSKYVSQASDIPMNFVHGDSDNFVPSNMVYKCYDAKKGARKIAVYKGSAHARSIVEYKTEYHQEIEEFLKENKIID